jgi:polysaccharide biosynthesis transport protein
MQAVTTTPAAALPQASENRLAGTITPLIVEYLNILRRRKWLIVGVIGAAILAALVITLLMRPVYTAETRIEVSRDLKNITNVQGVDSEQVGRDLEFYQTQYSLLEARSLAERVVRRLRLDANDDFWAAHGVSPSAFDDGEAPALRRVGQGGVNARQSAAIDLLIDNISINPIRGSSLIDIRYSSYDAKVSALIANTWATEFTAQNIARKFDSTAEARTFLERRLAELRSKVEQSERALVDYASNRNIVTLDGNVGGNPAAPQQRERTLTSDSLQGLNEQLVEATAARIQAEAMARPGGSAKTNQTLATLRQERATAAAEYAQLMVQFEPGYPAAKAVQEQITELDRAIAREVNRIEREANEQYSVATMRENQLRARVEALSAQVQSQRRDSIQYNIFQREADTNRQLYDSLLQRYKEIGIAGVSANNIAVIDRAEPPTIPSSPRLVLNMVLALGVGMLAALVAVFILEQSQTGLKDPSKVNEQLGIPLLGAIPLQRDDLDIPVELADPKSVLSEAYLAVCSNLAFTTDHGVPRSLMLVSAQPSEGKSTSALALAMVLARLRKRVVLIDADLRKPSIHAYLKLARTTGVSNYLAGANNIEDLLINVAPGLDFMPAGPDVPSAAELLSSDRMGRLVSSLIQEYDHVIVDSAPTIGLADAPLISRTVEGVIFVMEPGKVSLRGLRAALDRLRAAGAPLLGAVMSKFGEKDAGYGYGYSYSYTYGSNSDEARND